MFGDVIIQILYQTTKIGRTRANAYFITVGVAKASVIVTKGSNTQFEEMKVTRLWRYTNENIQASDLASAPAVHDVQRSFTALFGPNQGREQSTLLLQGKGHLKLCSNYRYILCLQNLIANPSCKSQRRGLKLC